MNQHPRRPFTQPKPETQAEAAAVSFNLHLAIEHCGAVVYAADEGAIAYHMDRMRSYLHKAAMACGYMLVQEVPFQFDGRAETQSDETGFRS